MEGYWVALFVIILCCIIIKIRKNYIIKNIVKRNQKGVKRKMPTEMLKEFIGKDCDITLFNTLAALRGKIVAVEENWIKVQSKKKLHLINGDMISEISIAG